MSGNKVIANELYYPQGRSRFGRLHGDSFHHVAVDFLSIKK